MKKILLIILIWFGMLFSVHAQNKDVKVYVNEKHDTLIDIPLVNAKEILTDLLDGEIRDSILTVYIQKDNIKSAIITLQAKEIYKLQQLSDNKDILIANYKTIIYNNGKEITELNSVIKKQRKEIRKQKILKFIGFSGCVILPIATLLVIL